MMLRALVSPRLRTVALVGLVLAAGLAVRLRVGNGWTFTGSDGFMYMGAADELADAGRYAVRLPPWSTPPRRGPPPLGYCRPPGYPLFLVAVAQPAPPFPAYERYYQRVKPVQAILDVGTCLMVFLIALGLGGPWAAWPALVAAALHPVLALYSAAILTETLATFLTTGTLALVVAAVAARRSERAATACFAVAGAVAALGALVRNDGVLLLPIVLGAPLLRRAPVAVRLRGVAVGAAAFALAFLPWPVRNWYRFGAPHPFGALCDTRGDAIERSGPWLWAATWIADESELPQTLWCLHRPECVASADTFPATAFDSPAERREVARLLGLRNREGVSARVDEGFRALARRRAGEHPWRSFVKLPLARALRLWVSPNDLPLRSTGSLPWAAVTARIRAGVEPASAVVGVLGLLGLGALLVLPGWRDGRRAAVLLGLTLAGRTAALALLGLVESRYVLELAPVALALAGVAVAVGVRALFTGSRRARDRRSPA